MGTECSNAGTKYASFVAFWNLRRDTIYALFKIVQNCSKICEKIGIRIVVAWNKQRTSFFHIR